MPIRGLQWLRILQTTAGHAAHHRGDKNFAYCVVTPYVNPLLDRVGFWRGLERILVRPGWSPRRTVLEKP